MITFNHKGTDIGLALEEMGSAKFLQFYDLETGEDYATLNLNVEGLPLLSCDFLIKNYSENEGLMELLVEQQLGEVVDSVWLGRAKMSVPMMRFDMDRLKEACIPAHYFLNLDNEEVER